MTSNKLEVISLLFLALLVDCQVERAEALRDALFDIFPNIDYIEIVY